MVISFQLGLRIRSIAPLKSRGWAQERIARAKGVDRSTVAQRVKFHQVSDRVKEFVSSGFLGRVPSTGNHPIVSC